MEQNIDRDCRESSHSTFKHVLPFLVIPLAIGLMRGFAYHKFSHMREQRQASWKNGVPPMFAEMHRRAHAADAAETGKPAETLV